MPVKCLRYKLAGSEQELRNARKFVERQQLFEKKYMVGSKLGEQALGLRVLGLGVPSIFDIWAP